MRDKFISFITTSAPVTTIVYKIISSHTLQIIMTPLIFISFVVSLAIVDFRYSLRRSHYRTESSENNNSDRTTTRTPSWLHRLLFKYRPYRYVAVSDQPTEEKSRSKWGTYYHTKQRKLLKMEAADAFEIRNTVLALLGILSLGLVWGVWQALSWGLYATGLRG